MPCASVKASDLEIHKMVMKSPNEIKRVEKGEHKRKRRRGLMNGRREREIERRSKEERGVGWIGQAKKKGGRESGAGRTSDKKAGGGLKEHYYYREVRSEKIDSVGRRGTPSFARGISRPRKGKRGR